MISCNDSLYQENQIRCYEQTCFLHWQLVNFFKKIIPQINAWLASQLDCLWSAINKIDIINQALKPIKNIASPILNYLRHTQTREQLRIVSYIVATYSYTETTYSFAVATRVYSGYI